MTRSAANSAQRVRFELGEIIITPAASSALDEQRLELAELLARHRAGDWGDVGERARVVNEQGLLQAFSVQSEFQIAPEQRVVVVTTADRGRTTVHLDPRSREA